MERGKDGERARGESEKRREKHGIPAANRSLSARTTRTITKAKPDNDIKAVCLASCNGSIEKMENISKWECASGLTTVAGGSLHTYEASWMQIAYTYVCIYYCMLEKHVQRTYAGVQPWSHTVVRGPRFINSERFWDAVRCETHTQSNDIIQLWYLVRWAQVTINKQT